MNFKKAEYYTITRYFVSSDLFQIELTSISCLCPEGELFLDIGAKRPAIGGCKC